MQGKNFDCTLMEITSSQVTSNELEGCLSVVNKSGLAGKFKVWIHQHGIQSSTTLATVVL